MPFPVRCLVLVLLLHGSELSARDGAKALVGAQVLEPSVSGEGAIGDRFGRTLAWSGDTLVVGAIGDEVASPERPGGIASGSVSVYRETAGGFAFEALLVPSVSSGDDRFGFAVAIAGDLVAVGAPFEDIDGADDRGAVYVFERIGTTWQQLARITAPDGAAGDDFGFAVALDATMLVVGAPRALASQGRAYRYTRTGASFALTATLDGLAGDEAGSAVALGSDAIFVGVPRRDAPGAIDAGSVLCFARAGGPCTAAQITAAGASTEARFGAALAMQGDRLLVGAPGEAVAGAPRQGAAYAFDARASGPAIPRGRVVAADGDADDAFGSSLALDGTTIAIGAPGALAAEGMAYVFVQGGNSYQLQQAFGEPDGGLLDLYGASVALRGDRLAIGVELDNLAPNRGQGSVATWIRVGTTWTAGERIATGDGASREQFGASVAIDGAIAIVGSPLDDPAIDSDDAGTATVYRREGAGWLREARLVASDAFTQDLFGFAVDASQDRVLVGTPRAIVAGRNDQGAAYVFRREGVDWIEEAKLVAPDGAMDEFFGAAVAIDADTALVGAPFHNGDGFERGAGYVFRRSGQAWQFEAKLESPAFPPLGVAGLSVALDGGLAVLGAPDSTVGDRQFQGLVHVFVDAGDTWSIGATIAAPDAGPGDAFGSAVALDGGELVVGAAQDTEGGLANAGSAYVFTGNAGGDAWQLRRRLVAPEPDAAAFFGAAVAIADGRALVGCIGFDGVAENAGVAFLYERGEGDWPFAQSLQAVEPQAGALFGNGVALAPTSALVGEPLRDRVNPNEGAAYLFADGDRLFSDGFE